MKRFSFLSAVMMGALALSLCAANAQASLFYHYSFDTDATTNSGVGAAVATANGSVAITAGGQVNSFGDFDGGDLPGGDSVDVNIAANAIPLGDFETSLYVNTGGNPNNFNDFFSFTTSGGVNYVLEHGGVGNLSFFEIGGANFLAGTAANTVNDLSWHLIEVIGTTSGADAKLQLRFDNADVGGLITIAGAAGATLQDVRIGGRVGADNRYIDAGIDEVKISSNSGVPEPASLALMGLGGLLMLRRRRVA